MVGWRLVFTRQAQKTPKNYLKLDCGQKRKPFSKYCARILSNLRLPLKS